jgi:NADH:ubiquinone reductase (H+-translocating)
VRDVDDTRFDAVAQRLSEEVNVPAGTAMKPKAQQAPGIVIAGGGVAGLILATRLGHVLGRRGLAHVTRIDRSWIHVWKPMLHTFAAGTWNIYQQQVQYVAHARTHHFEYVPGQLAAIDRPAGRARLAPLHFAGEVVADARELDYDVRSWPSGSTF